MVLPDAELELITHTALEYDPIPGTLHYKAHMCCGIFGFSLIIIFLLFIFIGLPIIANTF